MLLSRFVTSGHDRSARPRARAAWAKVAAVLVVALAATPLAGVAPVTLDAAEPVASSSLGIWSSAAELKTRATSGSAWNAVKSAADQSTSSPDLSNQDDETNVRVLAAAIVYARTGQTAYRDKVVDAIVKIVARGNPGGRTLAWARELGAYALAADLVGYRSSAFVTWLTNMAHGYTADDGRTLYGMFRDRPNNWGTHAFGALAAVYRYTGDSTRFEAVRSYWVKGVTGPNPGYRYGSDKSWHCSSSNLLQINPKGCTKSGANIDGLLPDDMRRGGSFSWPPAYTGYAWEALQGIVMAARIYHRAGRSIWTVGDKAIYRAAYALQVRMGGEWRASGDDLWQLAYLDEAYGTNWSGSQNVWGAGKNVGWGYAATGTVPQTIVQPGDATSFRVDLDTFVSRLSPSGAYSTARSLPVLRMNYRNYLRFDVTGIDKPVQRAVIRLYVSDGSSDGGAVYRTATAWTSAMTWGTRPGFYGSALHRPGRVRAGRWMSFDVTDAVKGNGTYAFMITGGTRDRVLYGSLESARPPRLVVIEQA